MIGGLGGRKLRRTLRRLTRLVVWPGQVVGGKRVRLMQLAGPARGPVSHRLLPPSPPAGRLPALEYPCGFDGGYPFLPVWVHSCCQGVYPVSAPGGHGDTLLQGREAAAQRQGLWGPAQRPRSGREAAAQPLSSFTLLNRGQGRVTRTISAGKVWPACWLLERCHGPTRRGSCGKAPTERWSG